ncbi:MAG: helix-turn-helix domain-containing protein [Ruminococcus sp.]|jgi:transcriptional regulator with XRE-family HTH domain|nr:helix-turn-helix domain-containing protein [Ruminococcus sp.]
MNSNEIGKAIKDKRKSLKLTQAETVGDVITRNMLSQVESGAANPSMKTLLYLTERLGLSVLVADSVELAAIAYVKAKELFHAGEFEKVIEIADGIENDSPLFDELSALAGKSAIELAETSYIRQDFRSCIHFARLADDFASKGLYSNASVAEQAETLIKLCPAHVTVAQKA